MDIRGALSYQASVFADVEGIQPSADTIPPLLDAFRDLEFITTTFTQITPRGPRSRLRLSPSNEEWYVDFDVNRINIVKNPTEPWGRNLGTVSDFVDAATDFVDRIFRIHGTVSGTRLALVTSELLDIEPTQTASTAYAALAQPLDCPVPQWC